MKRTLIIHVGMGKTGSSSIQKTLRMARQSLEKSGIKYLGLMLEHVELPNKYKWQKAGGWRDYTALDSMQANNELAHVLKFADEQLPASITTLVWSNESLFDRLEDVKAAIDTLHDRYDIRIVGYIRRPDSWITSAYLQWGIKHKTYSGPLKPFRAWVSDKPYVVSVKAESWYAISENACFYNFDNIEDVSKQFVEEELHLAPESIPYLRENDTPGPPAMALFAYHNSLAKGQVLPDELEPLLRQAGVTQNFQKSPAYNNLLPNEVDVSRYLEKQCDEIDRVNQLLEKGGQPAFDLSELKVKDYSTTILDTNRALLQLILHLSHEVNQLKSRLDEEGNDND